MTWSRVLLFLTVASVALFATGVGSRPPGLPWDRVYDVVLFNLGYLPAAAACWRAAARVRAERTAWRVLAVALLISGGCNAARTFFAGITGVTPDGSSVSPVIDALTLVSYVLLYVTLVGLIRARVARFHPSMWLDGLIGALGTTAVGVAFLLGPYLSTRGGHRPLQLAELAWPTSDLLLLALLVAVGAILGVRLDRTLLTVSAALCFVLSGDIQLFVRSTAGTYVDGGPLDLTWLVGICLVALAATGARRGPPRPPLTTRGRALRCACWRSPWSAPWPASVVLAFGWGDRLPDAAAWLAIASVLAALARTAVTFREVRSFHEVREEARTDELTGLPNRRALLERGPVRAGRGDGPHAGGSPAAGPRRLQGGQRQPGPSRGRPAAPPGRPAPVRGAGTARPCGPAGW